MPIQTEKKAYYDFPDGGKVSIDDGTGYEDIGGINSAVTFSLTYSENQVDTANAGKTDLQIRDMAIEGGLTLINLEPAIISKFGGGALELVTTTGSTVVDADITDQAIVTFIAGTVVELRPIVTATGDVLVFSAAPVLTSVTGSTSSTLAVNNDYTIIAASQFESGYGIVFNTAGTATISEAETVTVDFGDNDPVASYSVYGGASTQVLTAFALKIEHTNSDSVIDRSFEIYSANSTSGGLQFNFKGANEDGLNESPLTFKGDLDTTLATGRQLFKAYTKAAS